MRRAIVPAERKERFLFRWGDHGEGYREAAAGSEDARPGAIFNRKCGKGVEYPVEEFSRLLPGAAFPRSARGKLHDAR